MHYEDGTEAKLGDVVHVKLKEGQAGDELVGVLVSASASATTCNGQIAPALKRSVSTVGVSQWAPVSLQYNHCFTIGEARKLA